MTLKDTITIPDTVFAQMVDDEMVIYDTVSETYFGLDEMGAVIWEHLNKEKTLQGVYDIMIEVYEVEALQLEQDICRFVQELVDAGLLKAQS